MKNLQVKDLNFSYDKEPVLKDLSISIPEGEITVFIGGNGCGKSTLLRTIARLLQPETGKVLLDGENISRLKTKEVAKKMSILPQGPTAPEGLTVEQLVKQGRYPHQSWLKQWSTEDENMVRQALAATNMEDWAHQAVDMLSGGQRQRAWIAMSLAQGTETLLLDEPTTYLDMAHQVEVLDLLYELNETEGRTIVMVLHDMNMACRYAHNLVAIKDQTVYAQGRPADIMTVDTVNHVFELNCHITSDPLHGTPMVIPFGKRGASLYFEVHESL
ncbi:ABC transporter ATP-binding protein [Salibacterium salarium]|uniref:ABC transporter ATP-binding protein n=1 Tax=Salibacterium salarium TaxID=284579 RepID=A0A428N9L3_9BACI|nr:ABC transporter ATP-binding protein [Salibacterium salarium]RSL35077.1 ABC transporter ATP-binding protein [Salibacterium salarium]